MLHSNVLLIIPAWNEAESLPHLLPGLRQMYPEYDVLVVDDGSADQTGTVARRLGAEVVSLPCNLGIGGAVQTGFLYALRNDYAYAVRLDADGQHSVDDVSKLLEDLQQSGADVVVGSRFVNRSGFQSSPLRRVGIRWLRFLAWVLTGHRILDCTSGFGAYGCQAIQFLASYYPQDYPEPESVVLLARNHFRLREVPVVMREREYGQSSITGLKPVYYMVKVSLAMIVAALRKPVRAAAGRR